MKLYQSSSSHKPFLSIIACQHGNEPFGREIIEALRPRLEEFPRLQLIIANEEALAIDQRGVEGDLNRSYPGDPTGNHESRLAHALLKHVSGTRSLFDIHTSISSCGFLVPIVAQLNEDTQRIINLLPSSRIVCVERPLSSTSLIGNVTAGISLEFQKSLTDQSAIDMAVKLVEDLYDCRQAPARARDVFMVTGILEADLTLPESARDFEFVEELGLYPVLLKDPSYMGNQGLKATKKVQMNI
ncbi:MAG: succinylglutamate desuccinylase/aspartoacylase family protein [Candidatus Uhrbacteria bacterium]|nr:succinylglutamate desuccinylase/aspartoacylase family protein [Candidatus Uhrbacteria bacterium]